MKVAEAASSAQEQSAKHDPEANRRTLSRRALFFFVIVIGAKTWGAGIEPARAHALHARARIGQACARPWTA